MDSRGLSEYNELFLKTAQEHVLAIETMLTQQASSFDSNFSEEIFRHVHSLKGSSSVMGYKQIADLCEKIDTIIHPESDKFILESEKIPTIKNIVNDLKSALNAITDGLTA